LAVYPISYAQMIFQCMPVRITSEVTFAETGVDDKNVIVLKYPENRIATLYTGLRFKSRQQAIIYGTRGWITVPVFWGARSATLCDSEGTVKDEYVRQDPCIGWKYEIEAFTDAVRAGKMESEIMPLQASIDVLSIMDTVREQMHR
jgi:dihydrodiol dehydrogenase / D-xylose 1-dehydrogenase (NADP)